MAMYLPLINQSCVIDNLKIPIVKSHKFLGIILSDDMRNGEDLIRCEKTFLSEVYCIYCTGNLDENPFHNPEK